jgi:hypothetical protein
MSIRSIFVLIALIIYCIDSYNSTAKAQNKAIAIRLSYPTPQGKMQAMHLPKTLRNSVQPILVDQLFAGPIAIVILVFDTFVIVITEYLGHVHSVSLR